MMMATTMAVSLKPPLKLKPSLTLLQLLRGAQPSTSDNYTENMETRKVMVRAHFLLYADIALESEHEGTADRLDYVCSTAAARGQRKLLHACTCPCRHVRIAHS